MERNYNMCVLSLDVGGTYIKYVLMDEHGIKSDPKKVETPRTDQEAFLVAIDQIIASINSTIDGICVSLPGTIDANTGYVFQGGSLTYNHKCNLKEIMQQRYDLPVEIENDARCAALAELTLGNMKGISNGIVLTFGTGIGGCLILQGALYKGTHLFSGEVSAWITKDFKKYGTQALWGTQGSIPNFVKKVCEAKGCDGLDGPAVFSLIEQKDETVCTMFQSYCADLAVQLFNLQILFDPQRICIGGGVSINPLFLEGIKQAMKEFYVALSIPLPQLELCACRYHNDANLLGAYAHYCTKHSKQVTLEGEKNE